MENPTNMSVCEQRFKWIGKFKSSFRWAGRDREGRLGRGHAGGAQEYHTKR
jgi:hypothetical protein